MTVSLSLYYRICTVLPRRIRAACAVLSLLSYSACRIRSTSGILVTDIGWEIIDVISDIVDTDGKKVEVIRQALEMV